MAIRKILLPLTGTAAGESALTTALMAARIWNAHVTAMHVRVDSRDVAPLAGEGLSGAMIEEMMSATEKESGDRANAVRHMFERFVTAQNVQVAEARPNAGAATASFASVTGREEDLVAQQARLADLTVVPHPEAGADVSSSDALHAVLFDSGRPVLIAPHTAPVTLGTRVCLGWNGTAESAAAVLAALPWLEQAEAVRILFADGYQRRGPSAQDLAASAAARRARRTGDLPRRRQLRRRRNAVGGQGFPLRPAGHGRLFAFPPAPADTRGRHPPRAGKRHHPSDDVPLTPG